MHLGEWLLEINVWEEEEGNRVGQRRKIRPAPDSFGQPDRELWSEDIGRSRLSWVRVKQPGLYPHPAPASEARPGMTSDDVGLSIAGADPEGGSCLQTAGQQVLPWRDSEQGTLGSATNNFLTSVSLSSHW